MPRLLGQRCLWVLARGFADDVGDLLPGAHRLPPCQEAQSDLHVWLVLRIRVILRVLCQPLGDHVALHRHFLLVHLAALFREEIVHPLHRLFFALAAKHPPQDLVTNVLGQHAPVPTHDVQALELVRKLPRRPVHDLKRGVLLLLQEHQPAEDCIDLDLQTLVPLVHGPLDLLRGLHSLLVVLRLGVDEDGVRVAVDHVELELLLDDGDGVLQGLPALGRDERGQGLGVEAAVLEAEAAVHGVCGELQRHLPDLQRLLPLRVALRLHRGLDIPSALDEPPEDLRQHPVLEGAIGQVSLREEVGLRGAVAHLGLVWAVHGREADVVLLDDGGVEAVEVQEHHKVVVHAHLWLQDQASAVGCLAAARPRALPLLLLIRIVQARSSSRASLRTALPGKAALAVREHKLVLVELVAQEHLVALGPFVLERGVPEVPG
mmetsp:Transcript_12059/g.37735  ORF Transcript_12059/g.37735 Transcript_12059/m.37735 type:complete len:433 (+) Transcript_12059:905-2203(+)